MITDGDGYIADVYFGALKSTQRGNNNSFPIFQFVLNILGKLDQFKIS